MFFKKRKKKKTGFFVRLIRSGISVVVLTAFVLSIAIIIRQISGLSEEKLITMTRPIADKVGIESEDIGEVAGRFVSRINETEVPPLELNKENEPIQPIYADREAKVKVAIFADSHNDENNLESAINKAQNAQVDAIFHLGDHTDLGMEENLNREKVLLDSANIPYYALPGDRDLAGAVYEGDTTGLTTFIKVFGKDYYIVSLNGEDFLLLNNSANYTPIENTKLEWFRDNIQNAEFVVLPQPLYHPTRSKVMGVIDSEVQQSVKAQADLILELIRQSDVKAIIAGDHHVSSEATDPVKEGLEHIVVGAITSTINNRPQRYLQTPRFSILYVYEDGNYFVEEIAL